MSDKACTNSFCRLVRGRFDRTECVDGCPDALSDMDCDVCAPESHVGCIGTPYNGAAPMSGGHGHHRCAAHR